MSEDIDELGPVTWLRELFETASAESMYRWMMVAWVVAVGALILLDRMGSVLQGRSRPRHQVPPRLARLWRWRRGDVHPQYTMLPGRTVVFEGSRRSIPASIPLARSAPIEDAEVIETRELDVAPQLMLAAGPVPNERFWRSAAAAEPAYGLENAVRLEVGRAPERYNPVLDRIETLERDPATGICSWPRPEGLVWCGVGIGVELDLDGSDTVSTS